MSGRGPTLGEEIGSVLTHAARAHPDAEAVIDGSRTVTYSELARRVDALGAALEELSVAPGGRVAFLGANSLAHLECYLGVPAAGRVLVDLNFRLAADELAFIVDDCEPAVLIADGAQLGVARELRARCVSLTAVILDADAPCPDDCLPYEAVIARPEREGDVAVHGPCASSTLAMISYTGGTTGRPKGVMLSHGNLLANAAHNLLATGHGPADRWLHVCPMFHVAGTANVLACTWVGARQVIVPRFDAAAVLDAIEREAITHTVLVPTMLGMLVDELDRAGELGEGAAPRLDSLRHVQYAASPISASLQRRVLERFRCDIVQFYGMTEAAPTVTCATAEDHRRGFAGEPPYVDRLRSVGAAVSGVEVEVRDGDGRPVGCGEIGEIWVRGPNVMLGYWRRDDATDAALAGGWYRTGDAAYMDGDGYLYLVDRLKDMIISGGENVYCVEVETALAEHDAVLEAAVFGVPDPRWGEAVHAVVVLRGGATVTGEELIAHARRRIAGYKVPRTIAFQDEPLPKSGAGKVLKNVLREPFWADHERRVG